MPAAHRTFPQLSFADTAAASGQTERRAGKDRRGKAGNPPDGQERRQKERRVDEAAKASAEGVVDADFSDSDDENN